ncbi:c-type cytochrome [Sulfurospirillum arsenophilum]|uniref:c-type cytochrome n=1 Tax=Sulfurospirillum arsenophilum TaxID=56698 RepID=UPI0005A82D88|nr:hypothetical protein [Sulfurospirillum arsenophilum]
MKQNLLLQVTTLCLFGASLAFGGDVIQGEKLFKNPTLGGSTNEQSCFSCHANGALFKEGLFSRKEHILMGAKFNSVAEIVNMCIEKPLAGKAIATNGKEMEDILSYMKTIAK